MRLINKIGSRSRCLLMILVIIVPVVSSVPASPPDVLMKEITAMRDLVTSVSGQLDKFNSLYLGSLEQKMTSSAMLLAAIDSNVKHLQERAHVWDTFQLHVSAWNDQIKTVDKKMDLLSREQEKIIEVDNKLTTLLGVEYKMERVLEKLESFESKLLEFDEKLASGQADSTQDTQKDSVWNEFTGIGVLSTLKNIENKVDRLQSPLRSYKRNTGRRFSENDEPSDPRGKFVIRCSTPPHIEETIHDISNKVNSIHSRTCDGQENKRNQSGYSRYDTSDEDEDQDEGNTSGSWRRLLQSTRGRSESCLSTSDSELLQRIADISQELLDSGTQREALSCCKRTEQELQTFTGSADILLKRVERVAVGLEGRESKRDEAAEARFREQTDHFDRLIRQYSNRMIGSCSLNGGRHPDDEAKAGSGHFGIGIQDDTEDGDTDEESDEDIRIVDVEPPTISTTYATEILTPATSPREDIFTTTTQEPSTTQPSTTVPSTTQPSTTEPVPSTTEKTIPSTTGKTTTSTISSTTQEDDITFTSTDMSAEETTNRETNIPTKGGVMQVDHTSCEQITDHAGVYHLGRRSDNNASGRDFYTRYCLPDRDSGPGWTVIQSRGHSSGERLDFSRDWQEYRDGFGNLHEDFWMGNEYIHRLTNEQEVTLRVELEDFEGNTAWAQYSLFLVSAELDQYSLQIGGYRGNASDSLGSHQGALFSTRDRDNDEAPPCCPCAQSYGGGWWFNSCFEANLNGPYYNAPHDNEYYRGIIWEHWLGDYSLRRTRMMVRSDTTNGRNSVTSSESRYDEEETPPDDP